MFGLLAKYAYLYWTNNCQYTLEVLKEKLTTSPILRDPNWALPFHIYTDASNKSMGGYLVQVEDKFPYSIYFISNNLSKVELNYTVTENELLVIVHYLNKFRHNITGYQTFVHTDHATIKIFYKEA